MPVNARRQLLKFLKNKTYLRFCPGLRLNTKYGTSVDPATEHTHSPVPLQSRNVNQFSASELRYLLRKPHLHGALSD